MINNYFFQFKLPDKDFKIKLKRNMGSLMIQKLQEKEQPAKKTQKSQLLTTQNIRKSKTRDLDRYMELIQKRAKKSFINATYNYPRTQDSNSSTPRSVKSMKGVIIYKLHLQNRSKIQSYHNHKNTSVQKSSNYMTQRLSNRALLKQKIFPSRKKGQNFKRLTTDPSKSRDRRNLSRVSILSLSSTFQRGNPLHNSMLNNRKLCNTSKVSNSSKMSNYSNKY